MKKKTIVIIICTLLISTTIATAYTNITDHQQSSFADILTFSQIDFLFGEIQKDSSWGHINVKVPDLLNQYQTEQGYLNMYTPAGWVVQNQYINQVENMDQLSIYFNLGVNHGEDVKELAGYLEFSPEPYVEFQDGQHTEYPVVTMEYNAGGLSNITPEVPGYLKMLDFVPSLPTYDYTKPNLNDNENVQCARDQCAPMGVANSLQYLENRNAFFSVPHDHVIGLYGDSSLVGQLDLYMGRVASSRTDPGGVMADELMEGKFQYLADNGMENKLIHRHQGHGYFDAPVGDFTHAGITSDDQSVGGKVTFDWIEEQLRNCEDVEIAIKWGGGGGHMVRVFGCGKVLGQPYLRFKHDSLQTHHDSTDTRGLEEAQMFVTDIDGDGMMNWGSAGNEIVFALSESVSPLSVAIILNPFHVYAFATLKNLAEYDLQEVIWSIEAEGFIPYGQLYEGTTNIPAKDKSTVKSGIILGFGPTTITATVSIRALEIMTKAQCFLLGPILLGMQEI